MHEAEDTYHRSNANTCPHSSDERKGPPIKKFKQVRALNNVDILADCLQRSDRWLCERDPNTEKQGNNERNRQWCSSGQHLPQSLPDWHNAKLQPLQEKPQAHNDRTDAC